MVGIGAPGTARTCNPQIRSLVLYPLSYGRGAPEARRGGEIGSPYILRLAASLKTIAPRMQHNPLYLERGLDTLAA